MTVLVAKQPRTGFYLSSRVCCFWSKQNSKCHVTVFTMLELDTLHALGTASQQIMLPLVWKQYWHLPVANLGRGLASWLPPY